MKRVLFILFLLSTVTVGFSQSLINLKQRSLDITGDTIFLDSLSVATESLTFFSQNGDTLKDLKYHFDFEKSMIVFDEKPEQQSIIVQYKVFPINFFEPHSLFNKSDFLVGDNKDENEYELVFSREDYKSAYNQTSLSRKGSISRGISFGNNQDVIVNSGLNLQLDGKLNDDLFILAAISDNNIPIQPDGNSQQLQEFDKVFIKLFNDRIFLTAGDFELKKPHGYFLNYYKKAQGADFGILWNNTTKSGKEYKVETKISGAVAKGKYRRQEVKGTEGNQGPYKLTGANNELYIVVLAGTEKVYIDGILMMRGADLDYVIDYNLGEIIFTARQPINKDKRIIVEFEYSDRNYTRFLVTGSGLISFEKSKVWVNIYDESDNKNQPFDQELSLEDKKLLSEIGDNKELALIPGFDSLGYNSSEIRYKLTDTIVGGELYDSVFVYSTNSDNAFYRVSFSYVGPNKGNYKKGVSAANGRVYEWVSPINGILQGDYVPYQQIVTPEKSQMLVIGSQSQIFDKTLVNFEIACSNNDINTFSPLNSDDDIGIAVKTGLEQSLIEKENSHLGAIINYSYQHKNFRGIENYRATEFTRDWNLNSYYAANDENSISGGLLYTNKKSGKISFNSSYLDRGSEYSGFNNLINGGLKYKKWQMSFNGSLLNSSDPLYNTKFLRHKIKLSRNFKYLNIGVGEDSEDNLWKSVSSDSIIATSYKFNSYEAFIRTQDSLKTSFLLNYKFREDMLPKNDLLIKSTTSQDISIGGGLNKNPAHRLNTVFTYRLLEVNDTSLYSGQAENNLTGRAEYSFRILKGVISSSNFYEIGSGLERKTEYSYIEVAAGQGVYTWSDYNSNGVQELDEFEVAHFIDQANFIRVINPTADYIKTYSNQINQSININPEILWRNKTGIRKALSRFSDQFAYMISQKNTSPVFVEYANPFAKNIMDVNLVSMTSSVRNSFSFNRGNPKFGFDYIFQKNNNKIMMVNGFDTRKVLTNTLQIRYNISPKAGIVNKSGIGTKYYDSEFFNNKNYLINNISNDLQLNYQPDMNNRISIKYNYRIKENNTGGEKLIINDLGLDYRLSSVKKGSLNATFNYIYYNYNAATNGSLAYEMLEGFMPGMNLTWSVSFQRQLSNGLQLNLTYGARKSADIKIIHTGGVQMRAFF
ncbi:MAG: hypothetical protein PHH30_05580 [Bacteroidales bacterium]|nr:hypothetical protein [Bacteroidales bacterium]